MEYPVVKSISYALAHATGIMLNQGTTPRMEYRKDPNREYYNKLSKHLRNYDEVVGYAPNQVFIGNLNPDDLKDIPRPWHQNLVENPKSEGKYGSIISEDVLIALIKVCDAFNLVVLEEKFQEEIYNKLSTDPHISTLHNFKLLSQNPASLNEIEELIKDHGAEPLCFGVNLVGCIKNAHSFDHSLSSISMLETLVTKATATYALMLLFKNSDLAPGDVDYLIECSEEACGDMNQRGGGNIAKSIGEMCHCVNATGSDTRTFCSGPIHAIVEAAGLVQSGVFDNVVVVAGGSTAKLAMNSREHIGKDLPVLEDMLGAFAVHISQNDGVHPIIRTDAVGKHTIGSGSSPQATMGAIVAMPLEKLGFKFTDIDRYAAEMHNPELTEPAGAGNIPQGNYKMIVALAVQKGEFEKAKFAEHVKNIEITGFAPTQGHIPSGVPYIGHCCDLIMQDEIRRGMIIGKGSLFLGRLTNLFDGLSFILEKNPGLQEPEQSMDDEGIRKMLAKALRDCANSLKE